MSLPVVLPVVMPTLLNGATNGRLDDAVLVEVQPGIWLERDAASSFRVMRDAAKTDGVDLVIEYGYRDYPTQKSIFLSRYVTDYIPSTETVVWNGQRFFKLPGVATAAVPGNSNHGWGLAVDLAHASTPSTPAARWMAQNADRFGYSAEVQSESWHWRRYAGDYIELPEDEDNMNDTDMRTLAGYIAEAIAKIPVTVHDYDNNTSIASNLAQVKGWDHDELGQIRRK